MTRDLRDSRAPRLIWVAVAVSALGSVTTFGLLFGSLQRYNQGSTLLLRQQIERQDATAFLREFVCGEVLAAVDRLEGHNVSHAPRVWLERLRTIHPELGPALAHQVENVLDRVDAMVSQRSEAERALSEARLEADRALNALQVLVDGILGEDRLSAVGRYLANEAISNEELGDLLRRSENWRRIYGGAVELQLALVGIGASESLDTVRDSAANELHPRYERLHAATTGSCTRQDELMAAVERVGRLIGAQPGSAACDLTKSPYITARLDTIRLAGVSRQLRDDLDHSILTLQQAADTLHSANLHHHAEAAAALASTLRKGIIVTSLVGVMAVCTMLAAAAVVSGAVRRALIALRGASDAKGNFLAHMSHEIRTPMTAILGYSQLLSEQCGGGCEKAAAGAPGEEIRAIARNAEHLLHIVDDILDFSKIEAGHMRVETLRFSPRELLEDIRTLMSGRAAAKSLALELAIAPDVPEMIESDPVRLRQVLINFVGNAIKFTERGSVGLSLECLVSDGADVLKFSVRDSGIGLDADAQRRLFRPFVQSDDSMSRRFGGTGLGLAICKGLAELLGGAVGVTSQPGKGSTFFVTVPLATGRVARPVVTAVDPDAPPQPARPTRVERLDGLRLLLAEDSVDNRKLISLLLTRNGAQVDAVEEGGAAEARAIEEQAAGTPYDVILMDMQMPGVDGYTATRRLRDHGYERPIVALTAHASEHERRRCIAAGCDEHATKPVRMPELTALIRSLAKPALRDREASPSRSAT